MCCNGWKSVSKPWQRSPFSQESISLGLRCALCSSPEGKRCADPTESFTWWRAGAPWILTQKPTIRRSSPDSISRKFSPNFMSRQYAVIFDAGSSDSRVHVFCFNQKLDLVPIGKELELFEQRTPGLSAYAKDPEAAAKSLTELLEKAEAVVPEELRYITPVKVGATAGLRQLEGDASDRILQAVRDYLKNKSSLQYCWSG